MFRFLLLSPRRVLVSVNIVGALIHCPILARWWTILPALVLFLMPRLPLLLTACAVSARPPQLSDPSSHFSPTNPSPLKGDCNYITRLFWQYCCTVLSHKTYTPAQLQRFNALHFKVLRHIFGVKSSYYHRVLAPSSDSCSNAFSSTQSSCISPLSGYSLANYFSKTPAIFGTYHAPPLLTWTCHDIWPIPFILAIIFSLQTWSSQSPLVWTGIHWSVPPGTSCNYEPTSASLWNSPPWVWNSHLGPP